MKALIVGIDYYHTLNQLTVCVNDAKDWYSFLTQTLKYNTDDITILTDIKETTKETILKVSRNHVIFHKIISYLRTS